MGESATDGAQCPIALPLWKLHLCKSRECSKFPLERQKNTKLHSKEIIKKVLKRRCLKCLCIVHLDLICMSYDKKKGWK
jgi:hypothetical protein